MANATCVPAMCSQIEFDFDGLTPTCWNIAKGEGVNVTDAGAMLMDCIRTGTAAYKGSDGPDGYTPDYTSFHQEYPDTSILNDLYNAWCERRTAAYSQLCELWNSGDYEGMITLMRNTDSVG